MPVGDVLVGDTGCNVEHDDTALALNIVTVTEASKLLLASSVPHVETYGAVVCREGQGMNLDTKGGLTKHQSAWDASLKKKRTHRCTSFQTRQSSDARIQIGKAKTTIRIDANDR